VRAATARPFGSVAVKEPVKPLDENECADFRKEAATQSQVRHANVLRILAYIDEPADGGCPGRFCIVMPLMEMSLYDAIQTGSLCNAALREQAAFQGAQGLDAIHKQGVLQRDIKSSNALVSFTSEYSLWLCWTDFGLAHDANGTPQQALSVDGTPRTTVAGFMGTEDYMAPELAEGQDNFYNMAVDVYAFGLVAAEIVSGKAPARRGVDGERKKLVDDMRKDHFDVKKWAASDLLEHVHKPVARCLLRVVEHCTHEKYRERPGMASVANAIFRRSADPLPPAVKSAPEPAAPRRASAAPRPVSALPAAA